MSQIPIVFSFDKNYALPASVAIISLMEYKLRDTQYQIYILESECLTKSIKSKIEGLADVKWLKVSDHFFADSPVSTLWSKSVYYRLLIADLLPDHDKVIWSDVDVLFQCDLSDLFTLDITDVLWAGVRAEKVEAEGGVHTKFTELTNDYIFFSGLMLINAEKWREVGFLDQCYSVIEKYKSRLKMFDQDVLNLASGKIGEIPFDYCVLENIYHNKTIGKTKEYRWLKHVYSDDQLYDAKQNPKIIHYAGGSVKLWLLPKLKIPKYYREYIIRSPIRSHRGFKNNVLLIVLSLVSKFHPLRSYRKKNRAKVEKLYRLVNVS